MSWSEDKQAGKNPFLLRGRSTFLFDSGIQIGGGSPITESLALLSLPMYMISSSTNTLTELPGTMLDCLSVQSKPNHHAG